jgi:small-conductance mechanosensitive channel
VDQPFRIGDRIEIQGLDTWGDVIEIGARTTRIRTRDNRMVVVPNSIIGKSQIVNYTYPDPQYRIQMDIGISYDMDVEKTKEVMIDSIRHVDGVLQDRPVEAIYIAMGDFGMIFRVRWWIESYEDTRRIFGRVNTALHEGLKEAGIILATNTYEIHLKPDQAGPQDTLSPSADTEPLTT